MATMQSAAERRLLALGQQLLPSPAAADADEKPKLAIVCTVWYYLTHAQHEGDRFNHGWAMNGKWHQPEVELVSIYVDQRDPEGTHGDDPNDPDGDYLGDLSYLREKEYPNITVYDTIAEALRCGGDSLAVDAVLIIGEVRIPGHPPLAPHSTSPHPIPPAPHTDDASAAWWPAR